MVTTTITMTSTLFTYLPPSKLTVPRRGSPCLATPVLATPNHSVPCYLAVPCLTTRSRALHSPTVARLRSPPGPLARDRSRHQEGLHVGGSLPRRLGTGQGMLGRLPAPGPGELDQLCRKNTPETHPDHTDGSPLSSYRSCRWLLTSVVVDDPVATEKTLQFVQSIVDGAVVLLRTGQPGVRLFLLVLEPTEHLCLSQ